MYEMCSLDRMFAANVAVHQNLSWATEHMLVDSSEYEEVGFSLFLSSQLFGNFTCVHMRLSFGLRVLVSQWLLVVSLLCPHPSWPFSMCLLCIRLPLIC